MTEAIKTALLLLFKKHMHIVLLRHCTRIDKARPGESDPSSWLASFDPPVDMGLAQSEVDLAVKRITNHLGRDGKLLIHCSPYNRCIQTAELLLEGFSKIDGFKKTNTKLRVDQALSEWLSENFNLNYLPPNDGGYSLINNVNTYLNKPGESREHLRKIKDPVWSYNQLGPCGDYGEDPVDFKSRCFGYLTSLLQWYYRRQSFDQDKNTTLLVISHGTVISTLLQLLLNRPIFNEIPVCTPVYLQQSDKRRLVFHLMDYDFDLNQILTFSNDKALYKLLQMPINMGQLSLERSTGELTIGSSEYTTVIQSSPSGRRKRRSNTFNLGQTVDAAAIDRPLRLTQSSKQLDKLNERRSHRKKDHKPSGTTGSRTINMMKLASYFDNDSDDESYDSDNSVATDYTSESITSRIPSLSNLNQRMSRNRGSIDSFKDLLVDDTISEQGRSELASHFLDQIIKESVDAPESDEVLTFSRVKTIEPVHHESSIIDGTFAKRPFHSNDDYPRPTFTLSSSPIERSESQIKLISSLKTPESASNDSLKEFLYESEELTSEDDNDVGWFGFNTGAQPVR